jgi:glycine dehydrogenase
MLPELNPHSDFIPRHIGPTAAEQAAMLSAIGVDNLQSLVREIVPPSILDEKALSLPGSRSEPDVLAELAGMAAENRVFRSYIGQG